MSELNIIQVTPERLEQLITEAVKTELNTLIEKFKPKTDDELLTPKETAHLLKVTLSTVHRRTQRGTLKKYMNGGSVYYKKSEVEQAIVKLNS